LIGDHASLVQADAGVLGGGLDDDRPFNGALWDRQILDDEEIRRRQAGALEQPLGHVFGAGDTERLKGRAGERDADPFEHPRHVGFVVAVVARAFEQVEDDLGLILPQAGEDGVRLMLTPRRETAKPVCTSVLPTMSTV